MSGQSTISISILARRQITARPGTHGLPQGSAHAFCFVVVISWIRWRRSNMRDMGTAYATANFGLLKACTRSPAGGGSLNTHQDTSMWFTRQQYNGAGLVCKESKAQVCICTLRCRNTYLVRRLQERNDFAGVTLMERLHRNACAERNDMRRPEGVGQLSSGCWQVFR